MGRPREFDTEEALQAAMEIFWRKGFEGTSLSDLTEGMGITRPSLYAAFGNKEALFRQALERYEERTMGFVFRALREEKARDVVEKLLIGFADAQTGSGGAPCGCLAVNAALVCGDDGEGARKAAAEWRQGAERALGDRLLRAREEGDLAADSDPKDLARYVMTVAQGMAVQAAAGADRAALGRVVELTMKGVPV